MNDLPQNELFSAYLDGELSAAEQAEMERLLATNPAARQLLDELRALSATLQSLPQQKVGEDLSQRVLRIAERRMLTGDESGPAGPPPLPAERPVPLGRSIYRRFTTPRILVRLALIAAVAVFIMIYDRSHRVEQAGREVALAPAEQRDESVAKSGDFTPPSIEARPEPKQEKAKDAESATAGKPAATPPMEPNLSLYVEQPASVSAEIAAARDKDAVNAGVKVTRSADAKTAIAPAEATASTPTDSKGTYSFGANKSAPTDTSLGFDIAKKGDSSDKVLVEKRLLEKRLATETDKTASDRAAGVEKSGEVAENMLVVHCDVSPEAVQNRAFDKLLNSNSITVQEDRDQLEQGGKKTSDTEATVAGRGGQVKPKSTADGKPEPADAADHVELVYVEATPAQVTATLEGLSAQPEAFPSVSIQPEQGETMGEVNWQDIVRQYLGNVEPQPKPDATTAKQAPAGKSVSRARAEPSKAELMVETLKALDAPVTTLQGRAQRIQQLGGFGSKSKDQGKEQSPGGAAAPESPASSLAGAQAKILAGAAARQRQAQSLTPAQIEQSFQAKAQQQVLFVLHVVGGNPSNPQAAKAPSSADSKTAKPAKSAAPPPARPAKDK